MQISQLLRNSASRFNQAADLVCFEYAIANRCGISCPSDRLEFNRLVKIKMAATDCESVTALHTINEANYVHSKLTA